MTTLDSLYQRCLKPLTVTQSVYYVVFKAHKNFRLLKSKVQDQFDSITRNITYQEQRTGADCNRFNKYGIWSLNNITQILERKYPNAIVIDFLN